MSKITKPAKTAILSKNLSDYKLTKAQKSILARWDDMKQYMLLAGKSPDCVRLSVSDYANLDAAIRNQSDDKRSLSDLTYAGVPVYSTAKSPQMDMLA